MPRIFRLLLVASALIAGGLWVVHRSHTRDLSNGEARVPVTPNAAPNSAPNNANQPPEVAATEAGPSAATTAADSAQPTRQQDSVATIPTSHTITRTPQSALMPVSTGKFQLYRQGDITYRINAQTGTACVLFATEAQWSKPLVYQNGCGIH